MRRFAVAFAVCAVFVLVSVFVFAEELSWRVVIPSFGETNLGAVHTQIIPSPFGQRAGVCPGDEKDGQIKCEKIFSRKWLRIIPSKQSRILISVTNISRPSSYIPDYSLFVSRITQSGRNASSLMIGEKRISFLYYTINADVSEAKNIEAHRLWLNAMARQKKKIFLSGKITRIETSDLALFEEDKTQTEFLDFYLSDIQFEK